ncbi:hypothetical protein CBL_05419 [Carabus blaptoides fortunei]
MSTKKGPERNTKHFSRRVVKGAYHGKRKLVQSYIPSSQLNRHHSLRAYSEEREYARSCCCKFVGGGGLSTKDETKFSFIVNFRAFRTEGLFTELHDGHESFMNTTKENKVNGPTKQGRNAQSLDAAGTYTHTLVRENIHRTHDKACGFNPPSSVSSTYSCKYLYLLGNGYRGTLPKGLRHSPRSAPLSITGDPVTETTTKAAATIVVVVVSERNKILTRCLVHCKKQLCSVRAKSYKTEIAQSLLSHTNTSAYSLARLVNRQTS